MRISIPTLGEDVIIEYPMTAQFLIRRGLGTSLNAMDIRILNLSRETRDKIFQDRFSYFKAYSGELEYRFCELEAGYGDKLYSVFRGVLFEVVHSRDGADVITHINVRDGGFDTVVSQAFLTLQPPVTRKRLVEILTAQFPEVTLGAVGDDGVTFSRPVVISGNVWDSLRLYTENNVKIDMQKVYALRDFEVVDEETIIINADTGLLQAPRREDAFLSVTTLFEPQVAISRLVQLESTVQPRYNGLYKVITIEHNCVMSGTVGGVCQTTLGLLVSGQITGEFVKIPLSVGTVR